MDHHAQLPYTPFLTDSSEWQVVSPAGLAKGVWSEDEHNRFLDALKMFPQGPWKAITLHIGTRSIRQVQTHAQKYMEKVQRRARGLKTAHPRLVRRDHRIDEEVEPWWKRETGMLAGSPSRTKPTSRRRRQNLLAQGDDKVRLPTPSSMSALDDRRANADSTEEDEDGDDAFDEDGLDFEPLPLRIGDESLSPLPTLEESLAVVCECLLNEPGVMAQLEQMTVV